MAASSGSFTAGEADARHREVRGSEMGRRARLLLRPFCFAAVERRRRTGAKERRKVVRWRRAISLSISPSHRTNKEKPNGFPPGPAPRLRGPPAPRDARRRPLERAGGLEREEVGRAGREEEEAQGRGSRRRCRHRRFARCSLGLAPRPSFLLLRRDDDLLPRRPPPRGPRGGSAPAG